MIETPQKAMAVSANTREQCAARALGLVQQFRRRQQLRDVRAAVGAFIGQGELCHAPLRPDGLDMHRHYRAGRADHGRCFGFVMVDKCWHGGIPNDVPCQSGRRLGRDEQAALFVRSLVPA